MNGILRRDISSELVLEVAGSIDHVMDSDTPNLEGEVVGIVMDSYELCFQI
jgi:hypothetical protein